MGCEGPAILVTTRLGSCSVSMAVPLLVLQLSQSLRDCNCSRLGGVWEAASINCMRRHPDNMGPGCEGVYCQSLRVHEHMPGRPLHARAPACRLTCAGL